jgi:hypothetical protein
MACRFSSADMRLVLFDDMSLYLAVTVTGTVIGKTNWDLLGGSGGERCGSKERGVGTSGVLGWSVSGAAVGGGLFGAESEVAVVLQVTCWRQIEKVHRVRSS